MTESSHNIITVSKVTAAYNYVSILEEISFNVKKGEVFVILGGSGSGKTTLFNHIIGLLQPVSGEILIDGDNLMMATEEERLTIFNKIGVMYQSGALFGSMNLLENVRLPLEEFTSLPPDAVNSIARNKLAMVGLSDFCYYMPSEISGGMIKRAAIARAMALDPKILFLDEPSAGLDPIISVQLDSLILKLAKIFGITFVVVSHELPSIFTIADRVIMLHDKKIVAEGDPEVLREQCDNLFVKRFFSRDITATC